ncbi:MAG: short-chain dehydrogenase [Spirochaetes bacterium]|nr:MAG: short-chain dehydrogenase [Spirochaetota bacterium]
MINIKTGKRFEGKVAVITGAAQGMGRQVALDMAAEGGMVAAVDIEENGLSTLKKEIEDSGGECTTLICDVSVSSNVGRMIEGITALYRKIDILVNNAGFLTTGTIEETSDELIDKTIDINLKGVLYTIRAVTPVMKAGNYGRIVNVASITGKRGDNTTIFAYGAAKGAVISLTRSVARQLGPFGITCNAIAPHAIMTKMMSYWDEEKKRSISETIPVRRLGTVKDVSNLILFLSSDESSFINGETVNINGGYYMD